MKSEEARTLSGLLLKYISVAYKMSINRGKYIFPIEEKLEIEVT